jgi:hypothetical protein
MSNQVRHDEDLNLWAQQQAKALRAAAEARVNLDLDFDNLAEEIESLPQSDRREILSRLEVLLVHLIKLAESPDPHPRRGWWLTVREQRKKIKRILRESPSLKTYFLENFSDAYETARERAAYNLDIAESMLPADCPYDADQVLGQDWRPKNRHGLE